MMFIVRSGGEPPEAPGVIVKLARRTPDIVPDGAGQTDYFCVGTAEAAAALREAGWTVVELHDGWYADDRGGGVAIWGQGRYWEIRDTPFTVVERVQPEGEEGVETPAEGDHVNVRRAIFGV
ncbi:MAG TPA: hypothetical protein VFA12_13625 [Stellaceae bacterium]|nr:hypothetical protein [Stellaceae bacterium]